MSTPCRLVNMFVCAFNVGVYVRPHHHWWPNLAAAVFCGLLSLIPKR